MDFGVDNALDVDITRPLGFIFVSCFEIAVLSESREFKDNILRKVTRISN